MRRARPSADSPESASGPRLGGFGAKEGRATTQTTTFPSREAPYAPEVGVAEGARDGECWPNGDGAYATGLKVVGQGDPFWVAKAQKGNTMTHEQQLASDIVASARPMIMAWLNFQPEERRQRLDGLQQILDGLVPSLEAELFRVFADWLSERAETVAGTCRICGNRTRRETKQVKVRLKRFSATIEVVRFRCRECKTSRSPAREWLGLQSGMTSGGLDRALTALSTEMSFGRAAKQMEEQHGHAVDRTLVERRTYAVGAQAVRFLEERRTIRPKFRANASTM